MKLFYQHYTLSPLKTLNAKDNGQIKKGLYLKVEDDDGTFLGDYFPHTALGDKSIEDILVNSKEQYFENSIQLAKTVDKRIEYRAFNNHLLNRFEKNQVTKFKLKSLSDFDELEKGLALASRVRLDANGSFSIKELNSAIEKLDYKKIEYIEDPSEQLNWNELIIPSASDFIENDFAQFSIVKPNRLMKQEKNSIISSYMGSDWGRVLCTHFLHLYGDFNLVHGIDTPELFKEQKLYFNEDNTLDQKFVFQIREEILDGEWHELKI